jgi:hypothetical protein
MSFMAYPVLDEVPMSRALTLILLAASACSDRATEQLEDRPPAADGGVADAGTLACGPAVQCPPNPAATCAQTCADGSNPCVYACVDGMCVARGCPAPPDAAVAAAHHEGQSCDDGLGCDPGLVCKGIGDPCPTYPSCKVCYLPCGDGGVCPVGYRTCFPPSGQGGDVCLR